jgi:hypothetical protein
MNQTELQHFILSYAVQLDEGNPLTVEAVISDVEPSLIELIRTLHFQSVHKNLSALSDDKLGDIENFFKSRYLETIELSSGNVLSITDYTPLDDEELKQIHSVGFKISIECVCQDNILQQFFNEMERAAKNLGIARLEKFISNIELYLQPVESEVIRMMISVIESDKRFIAKDVRDICANTQVE